MNLPHFSSTPVAQPAQQAPSAGRSNVPTSAETTTQAEPSMNSENIDMSFIDKPFMDADGNICYQEIDKLEGELAEIIANEDFSYTSPDQSKPPGAVPPTDWSKAHTKPIDSEDEDEEIEETIASKHTADGGHELSVEEEELAFVLRQATDDRRGVSDEEFKQVEADIDNLFDFN